MSKLLRYLELTFLFLLAVAFSLKQLIEPDLWWQLRTGEWILQTKAIPHNDPFSFTYTNTPWQNIKWAYEVMLAALSGTAGTEMLMLLQVCCSCIIVFLLLKISKKLSPQAPQAVIVLITGLSLIALEYRITGRSETISHMLFLLVYYILLSSVSLSTKTIRWIPVIMMCWANLHEAFAMGLIVLFVFTAVSWFEAVYSKTQSRAQALSLTWITLASIAAICINPNHVLILLKPVEFAGQVYQNKYTSELSTYNQSLFWTKETWITLGLFVTVCISVFAQFFLIKSPLRKWARLKELIPLPVAALLLGLGYIASTGHRNVIFLTLAITPVFVMHVALWFSMLKFNINEKIVSLFSIVVFGALYISVVTNRYYTFWSAKNKYGLEIPADATPIGAATFIEKNNLMQKPIFSDYLSSSYLLWRLQPDFKTFIDLRDLDIFPIEHFNQFSKILSDPAAFEKADSQYHFGSVVLLCLPQMQTLHAHLYHHPSYRLAYLDAICTVYIKDSTINPVQTYTPLSHTRPSHMAYCVSKTFNPTYIPNNTESYDEAYPAAEYFYGVGEWNIAKQFAQQSVSKGIDPPKGLVMLGLVTYQQAQADTTALRQSKLDSVSMYMHQALKLNADYVPALINLGTISFQQQQYKTALNHLEKACSLEPNNLSAHVNAAEVYKVMAGSNNVKKHLEKALEHFEKANDINPNNPEIMLNLGFLYYRNNDCANAVPFLEQIVNYPDITDIQRSRAREAILKCN